MCSATGLPSYSDTYLQTQSQTTGSVRSDAAGSDPVVTVVSRGSATAPSAKWQVECGVGSVAQCSVGADSKHISYMPCSQVTQGSSKQVGGTLCCGLNISAPQKHKKTHFDDTGAKGDEEGHVVITAERIMQRAHQGDARGVGQ